MNTLKPLLLVGAAAVLVGCASVRHLESAPPAKAINLPETVAMKSLGVETILPAGDYLPVMEDDKGYYYEAPTKIILNDTATQISDGGLYLTRGSSAPTHYYSTTRRGLTAIRKLKTVPQDELEQ